MENPGQRNHRALLLPCPFQGHINPMLQLGTALHCRGFYITIVHTLFNSPDPTSYPEFDFRSIPDGLQDDVISSGNLLDVVCELNIKCKIPFQEYLEEMIKRRMPHDRITCVIYDEHMFFAEAVADNLKLPSIVLRTMNAATFISRIAILQLREEGRIPFEDSISGEPMPNLPWLRFKDLPFPKYGASEKFFYHVAEACNTGKSTAVVWNTSDYLEQSLLTQLQNHSSIPIFPVGPIHKFAPGSSSSLLKEDDNCISWLNKQTDKSVLYVSFGSVVRMDESEVTEMAWGLASSKQRFLWVVRPGSIDGSEEWIESLPNGFIEAVGETGCIVKWAPQKQVLAHAAVGGFLTHCGWNSTMESVSEGVPMICRPHHGDQLVNARYISHAWGIGLQLENKLDRKDVARAVRQIMVDEEGEEMRERAKEMKKKAGLCISNGGSSYIALNKLAEFVSLVA